MLLFPIMEFVYNFFHCVFTLRASPQFAWTEKRKGRWKKGWKRIPNNLWRLRKDLLRFPTITVKTWLEDHSTFWLGIGAIPRHFR